jgi:cell division transport system ATP-binding protein
LVEGEAHIVDFDLATLKKKHTLFKKKIGIVFQDFKLLPDRTIKDNMLFVLKATGWTIKEDMDKN